MNEDHKSIFEGRARKFATNLNLYATTQRSLTAESAEAVEQARQAIIL